MKKSIVVFIFTVCLLAGMTQTQAQTSSTKPKTLDIVFGEMKSYTHPTKWFSIKVPDNWKVGDLSKDDEVIVNMDDPTENGSAVVRVWNQQKQMTQNELGEFLKTFLEMMIPVSEFPNFKMNKAEPQTNGSVKIGFTYDAIIEKVSYPMICDAFILQKGNRAALLVFILPAEQYADKKASAYKMINSLSLN